MAILLKKEVLGGQVWASLLDDYMVAAHWICDDCKRGWQTFMDANVSNEDLLIILSDYLADHVSHGHSDNGR